MPRVYTRTKNKAGAERKCGVCGITIEPGQTYLSWEFRYGGTYYRCALHPPRPSDLTQSKMSTVYAAIENAEDNLPSAETVAEVKELVESVAEAANEVTEEYREASEPFGYSGENAERADELEGWASDLDSFDPEEPSDDEFDEEEHDQEAKDRSDAEGEPYSMAMQYLRDEWEREHEADTSAVDTAREEASELLGNCPL